MAAKFLTLLLFLSLISLSSSLPSNSFSNAIEILSSSRFSSMALAVEFASKNLIPQSPSLTIFTPSDSAFASSGQSSVSLLQLHFSPLFYSPQSLKTLPFNFKIPTLSPTHFLIVTSPPSHDHISLNGVKINVPAIYDDGSLIIFEIDEFFDPTFRASRSHGTQSNSNGLECIASVQNGSMSFDEASRAMRENGYSAMASFLELQLGDVRYPTLLTVFAPPDEVMMRHFGNFSEYPSIFFRHIVPCKMPWWVMIRLDFPTVIPTFLEGYSVTITLCEYLCVNEVPLDVADIYVDDWISVHGLRDILPAVTPSPASDGSSHIRRSMENLKVMKVMVAFSSLFLCNIACSSVIYF